MISLAYAATAPASAEAYRIGGQRWPGTTITFANAAPGYGTAVRRAVRAWNRARIGIRFERTSRSEAQVILRYAGDTYVVTLTASRNGTLIGLQRPSLASSY